MTIQTMIYYFLSCAAIYVENQINEKKRIFAHYGK